MPKTQHDEMNLQTLQSAINDRKSHSNLSSDVPDTAWEPMRDLLLVRKYPDPEMRGSIHLPENARKHLVDYAAKGIVLKVGPGKRIDATRRESMEVQPGDEIIFGRWTDWESFGEGVVLIQQADIRLVTKRAARPETKRIRALV